MLSPSPVGKSRTIGQEEVTPIFVLMSSLVRPIASTSSCGSHSNPLYGIGNDWATEYRLFASRYWM